jgi:putative heme-binding domain-containing protein
MFGRPERLAVLLSAVEGGKIERSQLDPARVDMLLNSPDDEVRSRAATLFAKARPADRADAVAAYRAVLEWKADRARGKQVFKKECAICHRLEGEGYDLGLPLQSVRNRGRETILVSVLDPNREVNPTYLNYVALTEDGLTFTGMIASETATSITLKRAENQSDTVLRTEIEELVSTGKSIMPEGLEKQIPKQAMADLIEYLMTVE